MDNLAGVVDWLLIYQELLGAWNSLLDNTFPSIPLPEIKEDKHRSCAKYKAVFVSCNQGVNDILIIVF